MTGAPPWVPTVWDPATDLRTIRAQWPIVGQLAASPALLAVRTREVSEWSVGEQALHVVITGEIILANVVDLLDDPQRDAEGAPADFAESVLSAGRLRRGVAKAPEMLQPVGRSMEGLQERVSRLADGWGALEVRAGDVGAATSRSQHFAFGWLDARSWVRVCSIHTAHHLLIVRDILQGSEPPVRLPALAGGGAP